jgi:hypothetical protein
MFWKILCLISDATWQIIFIFTNTHDRKQLNVCGRNVYRRILGPVYGDEKENWRISTDKEIYAIVKNPTYRYNKAT